MYFMKITITLFLAPATDWPSPIAVFPERLWQETEWDFVFVCVYVCFGGLVCVCIACYVVTRWVTLHPHIWFWSSVGLTSPPFSSLCLFFFYKYTNPLCDIWPRPETEVENWGKQTPRHAKTQNWFAFNFFSMAASVQRLVGFCGRSGCP